MTTPTLWSDVPPSEAGWYWLRKLRTGQCVVRCRNEDASWPVGHLGSDDEVMRDYYQFGPRVLTAEETVQQAAEVERLRADIQQVQELREKHEKPLLGITSPMGLIPDDDDFPSIPFEVVQKLKCVPAEELQQLRAAAAELAEIHRAWGMA